MNTYPISTENKHKETQIINTILHINGYTPQILAYKRIKPRTQHLILPKNKNGQRSHMLARKPELLQNCSSTLTYRIQNKQHITKTPSA
jgi:hypothetical protein